MVGGNQSAEALRSLARIVQSCLVRDGREQATIAHRRRPSSNGLSIPSFLQLSQLRRRDRGYRENWGEVR